MGMRWPLLLALFSILLYALTLEPQLQDSNLAWGEPLKVKVSDTSSSLDFDFYLCSPPRACNSEDYNISVRVEGVSSGDIIEVYEFNSWELGEWNVSWFTDQASGWFKLTVVPRELEIFTVYTPLKSWAYAYGDSLSFWVIVKDKEDRDLNDLNVFWVLDGQTLREEWLTSLGKEYNASLTLHFGCNVVAGTHTLKVGFSGAYVPLEYEWTFEVEKNPVVIELPDQDLNVGTFVTFEVNAWDALTETGLASLNHCDFDFNVYFDSHLSQVKSIEQKDGNLSIELQVPCKSFSTITLTLDSPYFQGSKSVNASAHGPDIVAEILGVRLTQDYWDINFQVKNEGDLSTGDFDVWAYYKRDAQDYMRNLTSITLSQGPGEANILNFRVSPEEQEFLFFVVLDPQDQVCELNEENNEISKQLVFRNLKVDGEVPQGYARGMKLLIELQVTCEGIGTGTFSYQVKVNGETLREGSSSLGCGGTWSLPLELDTSDYNDDLILQFQIWTEDVNPEDNSKVWTIEKVDLFLEKVREERILLDYGVAKRIIMKVWNSSSQNFENVGVSYERKFIDLAQPMPESWVHFPSSLGNVSAGSSVTFEVNMIPPKGALHLYYGGLIKVCGNLGTQEACIAEPIDLNFRYPTHSYDLSISLAKSSFYSGESAEVRVAIENKGDFQERLTLRLKGPVKAKDRNVLIDLDETNVYYLDVNFEGEPGDYNLCVLAFNSLTLEKCVSLEILEKKEKGESCTWDYECVTGHCAFGVCAEKGCSEDEECGPGYYCEDGTCRAKKGLLESCSRDPECISGICHEWRCVECVTSQDCPEAKYCAQGVCANKKEIGEACISDEECFSGICDQVCMYPGGLRVTLIPSKPTVGKSLIILVTDDKGRPIKGAEVKIGPKSYLTDEGGKVVMVVEEEIQEIEVSALGYGEKSVKVEAEKRVPNLLLLLPLLLLLVGVALYLKKRAST